MFKMTLYLLKRERKGLLIGLGINLLITILVGFHLVQNLPIEKLFVFYNLFLLLYIVDRFSVQMERCFSSEESIHFLQVPLSIHAMINAHLMALWIVYSIWFAMIWVLLRTPILGIYIAIYLVVSAFCLLSTVLSYAFKRFNFTGTFATAFTIVMSGFIGIILFWGLRIHIPYFYNIWIGVVSLALIVGGISYYFIGKRWSGESHKKVFSGVLTLTLIFSIVTYGVGQMTTYQNRVEDILPSAFEEDEAIQGQWYLAGIDYDSKAIDQVDVTTFAEGKLDLNQNYFLEVYPEGKTNATFKYTKGVLYDEVRKVASSYEVKRVLGETYLIVQWKGNAYSYRGKAPTYYVYKASLE